MNRLPSEFDRLYSPSSASGQGSDGARSGLVASDGTVRAMVMELCHPATWDALSPAWRGVQAELDLPAPAIAVSGHDAFQLWFSLAVPVPAVQAQAFLELLRIRFLADVAPQRVRLMPAMKASAPGQVEHAPPVPAEQVSTGYWSAFLAPDLAPVFDETPWLDIPPSEDGQADLLRRLDCINKVQFEAALNLLRPATPEPLRGPPDAAEPISELMPMGTLGTAERVDPRRFLQQVLNDPRVALALRIEAAKALLGLPGG